MKLRAASIVLCLLTGLAGCSREKAKDDGVISIAVIPKGTTHEFWKSIHAGAIKASRESKVEIIWKGALKEDDRDAQISVVEDFITRGVSGIVLAPIDDLALRAPVANAVASGIPVVIIDSDLKSNDYVSFVATDNYLGGKMGAQELLRILKGRGRVIMMRVLEGSASTTFREQGFLDVMAATPAIEVVSANQYAGPTVETAYRTSENILAPLKDARGRLTIDGIFCPNESSTFGMLRALQEGGFAGTIPFVGFDSSTKLVEALEKGEIDALVLQSPFKMGYLGVTTMVSHLRGEKVEKRIDTGVTLVTRENMNQPDIRELIQPDLSKWLQ